MTPMNLKNKLLILLATIAVALGFAVSSPTGASAAPAKPRVVPTSFTACDSTSAYLGNRVCIDNTTGFGPVAYVFTGASTLSTTIPLCVSNPATGSFVATMYEWVYQSSTSSAVGGVAGTATGILYTDSGYGFPGQTIYGTCGNTANASVLAIYSNASGYELVLAV